MAHARRLPPLVLQPTQRAAVHDLDMHVQHMPPDALKRHRPRTVRVRVLTAVVAGARVVDERTARHARPGDEAAAAAGEAELVVVDALEVPAPRGVLGFDLHAAAGERAAGEFGGADADGLEGVGEGAGSDLPRGCRTLRGAVRSVFGAVGGRPDVPFVVLGVRVALGLPRVPRGKTGRSACCISKGQTWIDLACVLDGG